MVVTELWGLFSSGLLILSFEAISVVLVRSVCGLWYLPAHVERLGLGQSVWLSHLTADIPLRGARLVLLFSPSRPHLWAVSLRSRLCGCSPTGFSLLWIAALVSQIASCVNLGLNAIKALSYVLGRGLGVLTRKPCISLFFQTVWRTARH